ncbi:MAG: hypothetical protein JNK64_36790 [Myxococcales bacterium]|nr:hypothetical protein [Myxococcales bacterium]
MSDASFTDDELDQRLRAATSALAALAPAGRVDGLEAKVLAELADLDARGATAASQEYPMTSDTDPKPGSTTVTPPAATPRTDDSGLHDIRSLAQDTKKRISRRITSQHDVDDRMLSSSTGSLRAIALPEPAMLVALPEAPATIDDVKAAMDANPALAAAAASIPKAPRKRTGLWMGTGAVAVAAAAAIVVMAGGGGSKKSDSAQVASAGSAKALAAAPAEAEAAKLAADPGPGSAAAAPSVAPMPPPSATAPVTGAGGMAQATGDAAATPPASADKGEVKAPPRGGAPAPGGGSASGSGKDPKPGAGSGSAKAGDKPAGGAATGGGKAGGGAAGGGGAPTGEKSIEDLLNDASGGSSKPKDSGGGGGAAEPTGPVKTALEPKEIKAGMSAVAGAAQACYGSHGVAGHVKVKAVVAPSGSVTKVDATGEFAGTPTGSCVAAAVKGASFPSWTGAPMTVTYSFTLQE